MSTSLLEVKLLSKAFGGVKAVQGVSFSIARGEVLALIGPNGAGKSTCFNMLNGQLKPDSGSVVLEGQSLIGLAPRQVWRYGVGRTFQITATFSSMTVLENVQMALLSHHKQLGRWWPVAREQYRQEASELLAQVGLEAQAARPSSILAYGDLKRLELAMALANEPKLLLMDEPTAGMGPRERIELMGLTAQMVKARNIAVLFTEHDMDVVFKHADRVMVLDHGTLIAQGLPAAVRADAKVQAVYLGSRSEH